ncbi:ribonuclease P/MRP protein subunit POP5 [Planococcus citri]|uniref:ribonuclease P/MRP protein subunit POP5 n=1 Tax=Planococcus citri TaxID=170843 RepID=UPI0031F7A493
MVRSKYRYITIKVILTKKNRNICDGSFKNADLYKTVLSKVQKLHGDYGLAAVKTGFLCKYCNESTGVAILKMRHGPHRFVCTVIPLITELGKEPVQLQTIRITATLHQAFIHLKIHQEKELEKIWNCVKDEDKTQTKAQYRNLSSIEELLLSEKQRSSSQ